MKSVVTLTLLALVAGCMLGVLHKFTDDRIDQNRRDSEERILADLVDSTDPEFLHKQGIALVETEIRGYGGSITVVVAYKDEEIFGVRVLSHGETPGFSDVLDPSGWIGQFGKFSVAEVDAVSGATITTRAVKRAIKDSIREREDTTL